MYLLLNFYSKVKLYDMLFAISSCRQHVLLLTRLFNVFTQIRIFDQIKKKSTHNSCQACLLVIYSKMAPKYPSMIQCKI